MYISIDFHESSFWNFAFLEQRCLLLICTILEMCQMKQSGQAAVTDDLCKFHAHVSSQKPIKTAFYTIDVVHMQYHACTRACTTLTVRAGCVV